MGRSRSRQLPLTFRSRGGKRRGAGRKPKGKRAGVAHRARPELDGRKPLHVTLKMVRGVPSLRFKVRFRAIKNAIARGRERDDFRTVHFSVQRDHVHLIVEADSRQALARGMQSLTVRIWWGLRHATNWAGKLFADRYHVHVLKSLREVRAAIVYVLQNGLKHLQAGLRVAGGWVDPCSSAAAFDGWKKPLSSERLPPVVVAAPRTWMLGVGWKRLGLISTRETPASA